MATMRHLLTRKGEAALAATMRQHPLLAFDFDGTLAPIVPRPHQARIPTAVSARLAWLVARLPLAIVTGRSVADVRARLGFKPTYIVGNHGAEDDADPVGSASRAGALDPLRRLLASRAAALGEAGVLVEDKGQSIALHYRLSRKREQALGQIRELLSSSQARLHVFAASWLSTPPWRARPTRHTPCGRCCCEAVQAAHSSPTTMSMTSRSLRLRHRVG